jgi:DNA polymerase III delta prime subunit
MLETMNSPAGNPIPAVPVLLFTGPTGAGKTTVAMEASRLLGEAGMAHAMVDLAVIAECYPTPPADPWNERLVHENLACMWQNFRRAGASRLILSRVLEDRSLLRPIRAAVPGAKITVIMLQARLSALQERIRSREAGRDPRWYLDTGAYLADQQRGSGVSDHAVRNENRPAADAAWEALRLAGWLTADP